MEHISLILDHLISVEELTRHGHKQCSVLATFGHRSPKRIDTPSMLNTIRYISAQVCISHTRILPVLHSPHRGHMFVYLTLVYFPCYTVHTVDTCLYTSHSCTSRVTQSTPWTHVCTSLTLELPAKVHIRCFENVPMRSIYFRSMVAFILIAS